MADRHTRMKAGTAALIALMMTSGLGSAQEPPPDAASPALPVSNDPGLDPDYMVSRTITLVGTESLLGKSVSDRDGQVVGDIEYLMLDSEAGTLQYVVLDTGWFFEDEALLIVPWSEISAIAWRDRVDLRVTRADLEEAPRVNQDDLEHALDEVAVTEVHEYWTALAPETRSDAASSGDAAGSPSAATTRPDVRSQVVVGQGQLRTVAQRSTLTAAGIVGSEVEGPDGESFGHVDELVIDIESGRVAYALVVHGSFLGLGGDWYPVPFDQLEWSEGETYRLRVDPDTVRQREGFTAARVPASVPREDLASLYREFGSTPYWETVPE